MAESQGEYITRREEFGLRLVFANVLGLIKVFGPPTSRQRWLRNKCLRIFYNVIFGRDSSAADSASGVPQGFYSPSPIQGPREIDEGGGAGGARLFGATHPPGLCSVTLFVPVLFGQ